MNMRLTGIIKKAGNYYVALCLELNVSSHGESIERGRPSLYAEFSKETILSITTRARIYFDLFMDYGKNLTNKDKLFWGIYYVIKN